MVSRCHYGVVVCEPPVPVPEHDPRLLSRLEGCGAEILRNRRRDNRLPVQEDVPVGFLWHPSEPKAMSKGVRGYVPVPDGMIRMDVGWACVRPELDQIPASCKNWFSVQRWVDISNGKLLGFPLTAKLADVTSLTELREVNFKDWTNAFSIANGRLNIKDLKVNAGATDFVLGGSQGFDGSMDYALTVKLPSSVSDRLKLGGAADQLLQFMKDKDGRLNIAFDVGGTSMSPSIRLNPKAQENAAKTALEQKAGDAKKKLEDDLKKKAEEGLKKLFKRP